MKCPSGLVRMASTILLLVISTNVRAAAEPITLFNSGVDALGVVLPDGTLGDPHCSLTVFAPETSSIIRVKTSLRAVAVGRSFATST